MRLSVLFALQTAGFVGMVWHQGTPWSPLMAASFGLEAGRWLDLGGGATVAVGALVMLTGPWSARGYAALWCATYMMAMDIVDAAQGQHFASALAPFAHAVRWATPAAVAILVFRGRPAVSLLRWAAGAVFVAHGLECLLGHPKFISFLTTVPATVFGVELSASFAAVALRGIGIIDIGVGLSLMAFQSRGTAGWMAFWGFMTAGVRLLYFGPAGWPDALIRITNGGVPLWLVAYFGRGAEESIEGAQRKANAHSSAGLIEHRDVASSTPLSQDSLRFE